MLVKVCDLLVLAVICLVEGTENFTDGFEPQLQSVVEPLWIFKCFSNNGCQRTYYQSGNTTSLQYPNIDICRTVCGPFGGIWPRPLLATLSSQTVKIHPNFITYNVNDVPPRTRDIFTQMFHVVTQNLLAECGGNVTEVGVPMVVYITIKSALLELNWDTNENYLLDVQTKEGRISVHILAETVYGARHGLETLTQLVSSDRNYFNQSPQCSLHIVSGAKVRDSPVYPHRGLMLDTSRHFIPLESIKRTIDGMAASKLNVFHWHITDAQSFPMESSKRPQFTLYGAYSSSEIYTKEEIKGLIKYAQIRGIRVVIEIDTPAHASNGWQWGKDYGLGDLAVCVNARHWRQLCIQPPCGQLNPANPEMYHILKELYRDVANYLQEPALLHMGGDEVFLPCWNSSQDIRTYMKQKGFNLTRDGFMDLWGEFQRKALLIWDEVLLEAGMKSNQPVMLWSSELTRANRIAKYLDKERYVIEVWESMANPMLRQLLTMGYRLVSVPKDIWYLDHGFSGNTKYSNWRRMYGYRIPTASNLVGGEVAMWTEYVDENVLDTRVWPRAAAVAERLWANSVTSAHVAEPRLQRWRSRMIARGLRPDALSPAWCTQNDYSCPRSRADRSFRTLTSRARLCLSLCLLLVRRIVH